MMRRVVFLSLIIYALAYPISRSVAYLPLGVIAICAIYTWLSDGGHGFKAGSGGLLWAAVFLGLTVLWQWATLYAAGAGLTAKPFTRAINMLPIFALAGFDFERGLKRAAVGRALVALGLASALSAGLGFYQKATGVLYPFPRQTVTPEGKLVGFFAHHIDAGGFYSALFLLSLCLFLFLRTHKGVRTGIAGLALVFFMAAVLSTARTYYVSMLLLIPVVLLLKNLKAALQGMVALALLIAAVFFFSPDIKDRALSIADLSANKSNVERLYLWRVAGDMVKARPFFGVGYRQWDKNIGSYKKKYEHRWEFSQASVHHAHNAYLTVAAETGVIGLVLFLGFWLCLVWVVFERARGFSTSSGGLPEALALGVLFCLLNLLIGGMFEENFGKLSNQLLISFLVGLALFATSQGREKGQSEG